jgi:hypothetical protein
MPRQSPNITKRPKCRKCRTRSVARPGQVCAACKKAKANSRSRASRTGRAADVLARTSSPVAHPHPSSEPLITTSTFLLRHFDRVDLPANAFLDANEYAALFEHCSQAADRFNAIFGAKPLAAQLALSAVEGA